ncbi:MAG: pseudaminic acid synthase [Pseudomonadota bacterium]
MRQHKISINGRKIGADHPPYIIAELSANHHGTMDTAIASIHAAKKAGADAIKLQTYTADTMTLNKRSAEFMIDDGLWAGRNLYELYQQAHTPWDWHPILFETAAKLGITLFSSPFDTTAVDLLEALNTPAYKIASFEITDLPLIAYIAQTQKPMIISTGMASEEEIEEAVATAKDKGCKALAVLHCVSAYPAPAKDYHLQTLRHMSKKFGAVVGLSDHTLGLTTAICSIACGASIVEKHFTIDRSAGGPDDSFSIEPDELHTLCQQATVAWEALGQVNYGRKSSEQTNLKFRRSLYFVRDMQQGESISADHIRSIRPGFGLAPKYIDALIGKKVNRDIQSGTAVQWTLVDD